jgi:hypothetical protein
MAMSDLARRAAEMRPAMTFRTRLSRALAIIRCVLFHRRHHVPRMAGSFVCYVRCAKCDRTWTPN